jgi:hypothetical protein
VARTGKFRDRILSAIAIGMVLTSVMIPLAVSQSSGVSWLHTCGAYICDQSGQQVGLAGINIFSGEGEGITLKDIQNVKALGFNAIRLNDVYWGDIQPFNETLKGIDVSWFTTGKTSFYKVGFDQIVNWAVSQNMYVIICLDLGGQVYHKPPSWAFPGFPTGTTDSQYAQKYMAVINGTATKEVTGIVNTWKFIANRYNNVPNVMFELLNEPLTTTTALAGSSYKTFNEKVISAIESVETTSHLKLIQELLNVMNYHGYYWTEITNGAVDVSKSNVVWTSHHYTGLDSWTPTGSYWHDSFTWQGKTLSAGYGNGTVYAAWRVARVAQQIHMWNRPWIVTEFAKKTTEAGWQSWYGATINAMKQNTIASWAFFCYDSYLTDGNMAWNIANPTTQNQIMPVLKQDFGSLTVTRRS